MSLSCAENGSNAVVTDTTLIGTDSGISVKQQNIFSGRWHLKNLPL